MDLSLSRTDLIGYTNAQLNHFYPDGNTANLGHYPSSFDTAIDRMEASFRSVRSPRYFEAGTSKFNHLYSDHYIVYLWYLANALWKDGASENILNKLYYLNKTLHAFDCMFNTALPDKFLVIHGSGTVLGKATYGNYLVVHQGCTVGIHDQKYPTIGTGVALAANSAVIGGSILGDRVSVGNATSVFNTEVPSDHSVYRDRNGKITISRSAKSYVDFYFSEVTL